MPSQFIRFNSAADAFWHISRFLADDIAYAGSSFGTTVGRLQRYLAAGNYFCLIEGNDLKAVLVWSDVDIEKFFASRSQNQPYVQDPSDKKDGVVIAAIRGVDRSSLTSIASFGRKHLKPKRIFWNRHREREPRFGQPTQVT